MSALYHGQRVRVVGCELFQISNSTCQRHFRGRDTGTHTFIVALVNWNPGSLSGYQQKGCLRKRRFRNYERARKVE